jgi:hypothetical protein
MLSFSKSSILTTFWLPFLAQAICIALHVTLAILLRKTLTGHPRSLSIDEAASMKGRNTVRKSSPGTNLGTSALSFKHVIAHWRYDALVASERSTVRLLMNAPFNSRTPVSYGQETRVGLFFGNERHFKRNRKHCFRILLLN